jgi:hypothetical protein
MAEEEKIVTEEVKTEIVEETPSGPQYSESEQRAMELGWKPKDKWVEEGHDENDHRSAREFLERGEMIGKIRATERELQQTKQAIGHLAQQQKQVYERGYETAISDLRAQRKAALAEGDVVAADDIADKIEETKLKLNQVKAAPAVPQQNQVDPEYPAWVEANPWYTDRVMQKFADSLAMEYVANAQRTGQTFTNSQVRDFVTKTVKEEFSHRFKPAGNKVTGAPNPDGEGRGSGGKERNDTLSKVKSGLSEDERQIMKTIMRSTGMSEQDYLKMYSNAPSRN